MYAFHYHPHFRKDSRADRTFMLHPSGRIPGLWGLRQFSPKSRIMLPGQSPNPWGDRKKKFLRQKLQILICNNFCLKKIFAQCIFKALFAKRRRFAHSGQRPHPWADFAHIQSHPRFLSYKIAYQIWLS